MKRLLNGCLMLVILVYPFVVYFGLHYFSPKYIALSMLGIFCLRFIIIKSEVSSPARMSMLLLTIVGIAMGLWGAISNQDLAIKLYPIVVNLIMFIIFFSSLLYPPTVIERLARVTTHNLSARAVKYVTKVTGIWCIFFVLNGIISWWTALYASIRIWTFYNGFLSYTLVGVIFVTEFTFRQWVKRKDHFSE